MMGRTNIFFLSSRLCARLYWRRVSTGYDREIAPTGGCPSTVCDGPAVAPQRLRLPRTGEELYSRQFRCNFGDSCVIPEITRHAELVSASYYFFAAVLK